MKEADNTGVALDNLYVPLTESVMAVQWDGSIDVLRYLRIVLRFANHSATVNNLNQLVISDDRDQRGQFIPIDRGWWVVIGAKGSGIQVMSADEFGDRYVKLSK